MNEELIKLKEAYLTLLVQSICITLTGIFISYFLVEDFMDDALDLGTIANSALVFMLAQVGVKIYEKRYAIFQQLKEKVQKLDPH